MSEVDRGQELDLRDLWEHAVSTLSPGAKVWVYGAKPLSLHDGILIVAVQDDLTRAQLESRVRPALEQALTSRLDRDVRLVVTIDPTVLDDLETSSQVDKAPHVVPTVEEDDDLDDSDGPADRAGLTPS